jgi:hypothetical protein
MEGVQEFERQLRLLGLDPKPLGPNRLGLPFDVPAGQFAGRAIELGFEVPPTFPRDPPSGPHLRPRLLPLNPGAAAHPNRSHESPFGGEWEYWSRPFSDWSRSNKTVSDYLAFVRHLFATT